MLHERSDSTAICQWPLCGAADSVRGTDGGSSDRFAWVTQFIVTANLKQSKDDKISKVDGAIRDTTIAFAASRPANMGEPRVQRHLDYLRDIATGPEALVEPYTSAFARVAWYILRLAANSLSVPTAGVGGEGQILFCWDQGAHHFELEVFPNRPAEFFYRNRETGRVWGCDYDIGDSLPDEVLSYLGIFSQQN